MFSKHANDNVNEHFGGFFQRNLNNYFGCKHDIFIILELKIWSKLINNIIMYKYMSKIAMKLKLLGLFWSMKKKGVRLRRNSCLVYFLMTWI